MLKEIFYILLPCRVNSECGAFGTNSSWHVSNPIRVSAVAMIPSPNGTRD